MTDVQYLIQSSKNGTRGEERGREEGRGRKGAVSRLVWCWCVGEIDQDGKCGTLYLSMSVSVPVSMSVSAYLLT